jgi:hypothetical protein
MATKTAAMTSKKSALDQARETLGALTRDDLATLRHEIDILMSILESVDTADEQTTDAPGALSTGKPSGWVEVKHIKAKNGKVYGGYKYLRYRANGVKKSVYIGKADEEQS